MNHTGLKADNKGPGTFPEKRVLVLICSKIPRSHVPLAVLGVVAVRICSKLGMVMVIILVVIYVFLLSELL